MEPVGLGVIGCGVIGRVHLKAAACLPTVKTVAVADVREASAREAAEQFAVTSIYTSADALLADPNVEAVVLALPTRGRVELALRAFAKGKHVLTEKPVAMNADEVKRMIAARGDRVGACCSSRYRFLDSAAATADFIATGQLGPLRMVYSRCLSAARPRPEKMPPAWRLCRSLNGGGILVNWGCYDLDYLLGILGWSLKPKLVLAKTWPIPPQLRANVPPETDAETHFAAMIHCEDGVAISFERGEYVPARSEDAWQIIGANGSLRLTMVITDEKKIVFDCATAKEGVVSKTIWEGTGENYETVHNGPVRDFAEAIRNRRPPKTDLEHALIIQKITDAIYASAQQGRAVEIE